MLCPSRRFAATFIATLLAGAAPTPAEPSVLFAGQITSENAATRTLQGPDAIGGVGDWALSNGSLCVVVSDPSHESVLSTEGGVLVDLGPCENAGDQFNLLQPLMNFSRGQIAPIRSVTAEVTDEDASIVTRGAHSGVEFETRYRVSLQHPDQLRVITTLSRTQSGDRVFVFGDISLHGERQLSPFTISTASPDDSSGYSHAFVDADKPLTMVSAIRGGDLQVLVGEASLQPPRSYGLLLHSAELIHPDGTTQDLPHLSINSEHFSLLGIFTRPFWAGSRQPAGWFELAQTLFMNVKNGERVVYDRSVLVGRRADVASVTDQVWHQTPQVQGSLSDPAATISIYRESGAPVTTVRPADDGAFSAHLPEGSYRAEVWAPGNRELELLFSVNQEGTDLGRIAVPPAAKVLLPQGHPMRLVFVGLEGTPDPAFGDDGRDFQVGERKFLSALHSNDRSLAGVPGDPTQLSLAPGQYRVYATRGPEFSVTQALLRAVAGETVSLEIENPARVLEDPDWVSADLHVHSAFSDDSGLALRERLAAFRAQGADVIVSTEHDRIADYGPALKQMGLQDEIDSIVGVEITTTVMDKTTPYTAGHSNAFPVAHLEHEYRDGAPAAEGRRLRTILAGVQNENPSALVQLNHPRPSSGVTDEPKDMSLFTHLSVGEEGFDPTLPLAAARNEPLAQADPETGLRDLDFDAIELLNGPSMAYYRVTRADWFSLLLQGEVRTATANSDSHRLGEVVGLPRTYVQTTASPSSDFNEGLFIEALRGGRAYGSTGPLLTVTLGGKQLGETYAGEAATLRVGVVTAPWVPVSSIRVYVNGEQVFAQTIRSGQEKEFPIRFQQDSFVTVEVEGKPEGIYAELLPGFTPFAFSNPIFVDAESDGVWNAPGLANPPPLTLSEPLQAP